MEYVLGGEAPFQVLEPPAGPPKMSNSLGASTFHENLDFFGVIRKPIPQYRFFYNA